MRILFTHSYFLKFDPKQWEQMQPYAPLGTIYAASLLRKEGYSVALHDVMFLNSARQIAQKIEDFKPDVLVIYDDGFNYLTKMCLTNMREEAFEMAKIAKRYGCITIAASSDSTDHYEAYLSNGCDFVIVGEGEQTLLEFVRQLEEGAHKLNSVVGLIFKQDGHLIKTGKRPLITDLDSLPFPAWDLVDVERYKKEWQKKHGYFSINFATTRGCPFKCNWCAKPIYGNRYNARTPQNVFDEIKLLYDAYHFDHIWFCDDIFGLKPGWVKEFASILKEQQFLIKFKIQSRADLLLNDGQVKPLADAGCETVWMGAESGSQKILDAMDKGTTVEQIIEARNLLKHYGIKTGFFIQFGYLGEEFDDINKTIELIEHTMPEDIGISISYPLPGTLFYEKVKNQLSRKSNWTDSDDLDLMFENNYSKHFYKLLHRYVHYVYRARKGQIALADLKQKKFSSGMILVKMSLAGLNATLLKNKTLKQMISIEPKARIFIK